MLLPSFYLKRGPASKEIDLAGTNVSGDISALFQWKQLEEVDLSGTQMSGRLGRAWRGQVPELRILKLTNCKRLAFIPTGRGMVPVELFGSRILSGPFSSLRPLNKYEQITSVQNWGGRYS